MERPGGWRTCWKGRSHERVPRIPRRGVPGGAVAVAAAARGQSGEQSEIPDQVRAYALWQQGYVLHLSGRYQAAVDSFRESIEILPTPPPQTNAEGHTGSSQRFLGWSLSDARAHLEDCGSRELRQCGRAISWLAERPCSHPRERGTVRLAIAIALDPDYGNPYNDIGVYLIELGRPDEAIPWLEKAISAKRYCCYQFAHFNLGRVRLVQGKLDAARRSFEQALRHDPDYLPARMALEHLEAEIGKPL